MSLRKHSRTVYKLRNYKLRAELAMKFNAPEKAEYVLAALMAHDANEWRKVRTRYNNAEVRAKKNEQPTNTDAPQPEVLPDILGVERCEPGVGDSDGL